MNEAQYTADEHRKYRRFHRETLRRLGHRRNAGVGFWRDCGHLFPQARRILDLGCGNGLLVDELIRQDYEARGVDICAEAPLPELLRAHPDAFLTCALWQLDPETHGTYDLGICVDVLEHVPIALVPRTLTAMGAVCGDLLLLIAHYPSTAEDDGNEYHLTLQPESWWMARLQDALPGARIEAFEPPDAANDTHYLAVRRGA